jgi:hypothetical protein
VSNGVRIMVQAVAIETGNFAPDAKTFRQGIVVQSSQRVCSR